MYEPKDAPLASQQVFLWRVLRHVGVATGLMLGSLAGGMAGYMRFERLAWRDAFLNAAMLLGGMGPVDVPATPGGKIFAGVYALYAGLVFLVAAGVILTPLAHRLLHRFHLEQEAGS